MSPTPYDPTRSRGTNDLSRADYESDNRRRLHNLGHRLEIAMASALLRETGEIQAAGNRVLRVRQTIVASGNFDLLPPADKPLDGEDV